ncbi:MAG: hypothetical protein JM58_15765 [Peptococcaceae bacterium BICA1-8]|nr:MAG: hypothetical protein JM58_15765 [Peptococcaceae bacterium BICA1-8]
MIKFLSSIQLAITLIGAMVLASVFATLFPDVEIFGAFWFRGLLLLFCLNLLMCTVKSLPGILHRIKKLPSSVNEERAKTLNFSGPEDVEKLMDYLKAKGYKLKTSSSEGQQNILAQKGILNLIAPQLLHLSLILVLIGGFLTSFGVEDQVTCFVGERADVPASVASGMVIEVNDFQTIYDADGAIDNWITNLNIYVNDEKTASGTTKVNAPLKHQGVSFYQKSYGYYHLIELTGVQPGTYDVPDKKIFSLENKTFNIGYSEEGAVVSFFEGHNLTETVVLKDGDKIDFPNDTVLTYIELNPFTVLGVKKDPGTPVVMTGFLLMTIASFLFWTGRYREVAISLTEGKASLIVYCKIKAVRDEVMEEISERMKVK